MRNTVITGVCLALSLVSLPVWAQIERHPVALERGHSPPRRLTSRLAAARPHLGGELSADLGGEHVGAGNLRR